MSRIKEIKNRAVAQINDIAKKSVHAIARGSAKYIESIYKSGSMKDVVDDEGNKYNDINPIYLGDHVTVEPSNYKDIQDGDRLRAKVLMDDEDSDKEARVHEAMGSIAPFRMASARAKDPSNIKMDLAKYGIQK